MTQPYVIEIDVPETAIDVNGHVNNVQYVQWMQDAATEHATATGCAVAAEAAGCAWFARSHHIEYKRPAYAGERIQTRTWVDAPRRSMSTRHYEFIRPADGALLAAGETVWVYVDIASGRPRSIPAEFETMFGLAEPAETGA